MHPLASDNHIGAAVCESGKQRRSHCRLRRFCCDAALPWGGYCTVDLKCSGSETRAATAVFFAFAFCFWHESLQHHDPRRSWQSTARTSTGRRRGLLQCCNPALPPPEWREKSARGSAIWQRLGSPGRPSLLSPSSAELCSDTGSVVEWHR